MTLAQYLDGAVVVLLLLALASRNDRLSLGMLAFVVIGAALWPVTLIVFGALVALAFTAPPPVGLDGWRS